MVVFCFASLRTHFVHSGRVRVCMCECARARHSAHESCEPATLGEQRTTGWKRVVVSWINWKRCVALDSWKYCTHKNTLFVYLWIIKMPLDFFYFFFLSWFLFAVVFCVFPSLICTHTRPLINGKLFSRISCCVWASNHNDTSLQFLVLARSVCRRIAKLEDKMSMNMEKVTPTHSLNLCTMWTS